jgi:hypothetical protein
MNAKRAAAQTVERPAGLKPSIRIMFSMCMATHRIFLD